jgi:hypothetical protein
VRAEVCGGISLGVGGVGDRYGVWGGGGSGSGFFLGWNPLLNRVQVSTAVNLVSPSLSLVTPVFSTPPPPLPSPPPAPRPRPHISAVYDTYI